MARELKDSTVAKVRVGFDGRVHKWYRGPLAMERFENERRVLRFLEEQDCQFVPRILEEDEDDLYLVTSNCGGGVPGLNHEKEVEIFRDLESYGVEHGDQANRNITYDSRRGRFCVIDFEFAKIIPTGEGLSLADAETAAQAYREEHGPSRLSTEENNSGR